LRKVVIFYKKLERETVTKPDEFITILIMVAIRKIISDKTKVQRNNGIGAEEKTDSRNGSTKIKIYMLSNTLYDECANLNMFIEIVQ
jgi:hypothetical protein